MQKQIYKHFLLDFINSMQYLAEPRQILNHSRKAGLYLTTEAISIFVLVELCLLPQITQADFHSSSTFPLVNSQLRLVVVLQCVSSNKVSTTAFSHFTQ